MTSTCDNNGTLTPGIGDWPFLGDGDTTPDNEAIVPLCKDKNNDIGGGSAGSVGWLDLSTAIGATTTAHCANNFKNAIENPCITSLPFPTWVQTFPGGVGKGGPAIQDALNAFHNDIVQIPLFDGTCKIQPPGTRPGRLPGRSDRRGRQHLVPHPELRQLQARLRLPRTATTGSSATSCPGPRS